MVDVPSKERVCYRGLPLAGVESMSATTARSFPRHTHDEYGIGIIDLGGHASWSGRGRVEAGPGSFISVNPGEVHDGHALGRRPRSWRILYFEPAALDALQADVTGGDVPFEFLQPVFDDRALRARFLSLTVRADRAAWLAWARRAGIHPAVLALAEEHERVLEEVRA
jgi:hypothetical protein